MSDAGTPYANLDPDRILDAVESLGLHADGRVLALNSYENRVYRIGIEGGAPLVAKFYRPGRWSDEAIGEEHAFAAELAAADLSVVAPLAFGGRTLHAFGGHRFALFPLRGGHAPELGDRDTLTHLGRVLGRLHAVGAAKPFAHRGELTIESHGEDPVHFLLEGGWLPPELEHNFETLAESLLDAMDAAWERAGEVATLRLHGDCHPGNILWREGQAHFVDLDDCLTGPAVQDLWMLAGRREDGPRAWQWLLEGYEQFRAFDRRELHLVEALRTLRLLHHNAWIARRWSDPAFPPAFPWFEAPRHWESVITQMQEQLAALHEPPPDPR
ncbi:serine/threonine protein kinase [Arenimonas caeni]|uniref:Stress response kinase A n=1 Tax=Arenimonas caeni TaxID=2058085 RepID=A0A2P6MCK1_9GAMM|nr:serine/threonine protein kinase [Arenimonas caeni]MDY0022303.1 serine/threonine protein kinase [Arenimonas caeni]PRH83733.1 serine/threonine protein kinase [Arenimonas caeni]